MSNCDSFWTHLVLNLACLGLVVTWWIGDLLGEIGDTSWRFSSSSLILGRVNVGIPFPSDSCYNNWIFKNVIPCFDRFQIYLRLITFPYVKCKVVLNVIGKLLMVFRIQPVTKLYNTDIIVFSCVTLKHRLVPVCEYTLNRNRLKLLHRYWI